MKISVEKDNIKNAVAKNSQHCMIADAIKATIPSAQFLMVDLQSIRFSDSEKRKRYVYLTPAIAQHNILKFDKGDAIKPFSFSLLHPVRARAMQSKAKGTPEQRKRTKAKYAKNQKKADYAYLAANRARNHQKDREFGLRKFVD